MLLFRMKRLGEEKKTKGGAFQYELAGAECGRKRTGIQ